MKSPQVEDSPSSILANAQASIDRANDEAVVAESATDSLCEEILTDDIRFVLQAVLAKFPNVTVGGNDDVAPSTCVSLAETSFGRFNLQQVVGHGSFGIVVSAFDPRLKRNIALKLPRPDTVPPESWRRRVVHEARLAAGLDHPGIVPVYEAGRVGPVWFIASALCDGPNLDSWQQSQSYVPPQLAAELLAQIADAVHHAHGRGILHRDLKPSNILLKTLDGRAVPQVTDFGLAARVVTLAKKTEAREVIGTLAYMSPEQTLPDTNQIGVASDIYALGAILFLLLSGRAPFEECDPKALVHAIRNNPPPSLSDVCRRIPLDLAAICQKCLQKDPKHRYGTATDLALDLRRFLAGHCVTARNYSIATRIFRWFKRHPFVATLMLLCVLGVSTAAGIAAAQWRRAERNLRRAEAAILDLGWMLEDRAYWQSSATQTSNIAREDLLERYTEILRDLPATRAASPLEAAASCLVARDDAAKGKAESAKQRFLFSVASWSQIVKREPRERLYRQSLARTLVYYGDYLWKSERREDGLYCMDDGKLLGCLDISGTSGATLLSDYLQMVYDRGLECKRQGRREDAARYFRASIEVASSVTELDPSADAYYHRFEAEYTFFRTSKPLGDASPHHELKMAFAKRLSDATLAYPNDIRFRLQFAELVMSRSRIEAFFEGNTDVLGTIARSAALLEESWNDGEQSPNVSMCLARVKLSQATIASEEKHFELAIESAISCAHWLKVAIDAKGISARDTAEMFRSIGGIQMACGDDDHAIGSFEQAKGCFEELYAGKKQHHGVHVNHANTCRKLGELYEARSDYDRAHQAFDAAISVLEAWGGPNPTDPPIATELRILRVALDRTEQKMVGVADTKQ